MEEEPSHRLLAAAFIRIVLLETRALPTRTVNSQPRLQSQNRVVLLTPAPLQPCQDTQLGVDGWMERQGYPQPPQPILEEGLKAASLSVHEVGGEGIGHKFGN